MGRTAQQPLPGMPPKYTERQEAQNARLHAWKWQRDPARPKACLEVRRLVDLEYQNRLHLVDLAAFRGKPPAREEEQDLVPWTCRVIPRMLAAVMLACCDWRHDGLIGRLDEWATFLKCSKRTVQHALDELGEGWIRREYRFAYHPGFVDRDGVTRTYRQIVTAYRPGPLLRLAWNGWRTVINQSRRERGQGQRERERAQAPQAPPPPTPTPASPTPASPTLAPTPAPPTPAPPTPPTPASMAERPMSHTNMMALRGVAERMRARMQEPVRRWRPSPAPPPAPPPDLAWGKLVDLLGALGTREASIALDLVELARQRPAVAAAYLHDAAQRLAGDAAAPARALLAELLHQVEAMGP